MSARLFVMGVAACLCLSSASCGGQDFGKMLSTVPVHGKLTVNGSPYEMIYVFATPTEPSALEKSGRKVHPGQKYGVTSESGEFTMMTYAAGDGLPEGKYKLTFRIDDPGVVVQMKNNDVTPSATRDIKDSFNNRFFKQAEQQPEITVPAGVSAVELEPIDLTFELP